MKPLESGHIFATNYRIDSVLGQGGFATVYKATDEDSGRVVAIKIQDLAGLPSDKRETSFKRFLRESRLLFELKSPFTVRVFDLGQDESGLVYLIMEYIEGSSLDVYIRDEAPIDERLVVSYLDEILHSLAEAHQSGLIHRDIKPANLMLSHGRIKVLDFGIAKPVLDDGGPATLTEENKAVGTPRYMAPEVLRGQPARPASDLYALGLVAYELLTGERVFDGGSKYELVAQQLSQESAELPARVEVSDALRTLVDRLLAKDLERRYATCEEVLTAIDRLYVDDTDSVESPAEPETPRFMALAAFSVGLTFGLLALGLTVWLGSKEPVVAVRDVAPIVDMSPDVETPASNDVLVTVVQHPCCGDVWIDDLWVGQKNVSHDATTDDFPMKIKVVWDDAFHEREVYIDGNPREISLRFRKTDAVPIHQHVSVADATIQTNIWSNGTWYGLTLVNAAESISVSISPKHGRVLSMKGRIGPDGSFSVNRGDLSVKGQYTPESVYGFVQGTYDKHEFAVSFGERL